jgi:hypothetical protein
MDLMVLLLLWFLLKTFLGETSVSNVYNWSVAVSAPSNLFLASRFEYWGWALFNSLFSPKFWLRILMNDEISIHMFCHSLDWGCCWGLVKVLLEYDLSGHVAGECRLGWLRDRSDGAVPLLRLHLRAVYVEKAWNDICVATLVWSFSPAGMILEISFTRTDQGGAVAPPSHVFSVNMWREGGEWVMVGR